MGTQIQDKDEYKDNDKPRDRLCATSQGNKDQLELELVLDERMSNEPVDINSEEYKKVNEKAH